MKNIILAALILAPAFAGYAVAAPADTTKAAPPAPVPMTMKEVKQKLGIVVFPAKGQKPEVQDQEEYECLMWGAEQAGIKPGEQPADAKAAGEAAAAQTDAATTGVAVKGAALGAMTGAIWGNAGEGAAVGAIGGAVAGRRAKKQAKANAKAQAEQQVNAETQKKIDAVKKGMGACLTSKGYTVQ